MASPKTHFTKKIVASNLNDVFYVVLEKFPEFKNICMIVKESKFYGIQHTLRSYPPLLSLLSPRRRRVYPIVVNTNSKTPIPFHSLTKGEQIGSMAHELAHTLDYTQKSAFEIIRFSFLFWLSKKFVRNLEHKIDTIVIERGLGNELLAYRERIEKEHKASYSQYRKVYYMNTNEIKKALSVSSTTNENTQPYKIPLPQNIRYLIMHSTKTLVGFFPGIWEMAVLIYFRKVHIKGTF